MEVFIGIDLAWGEKNPSGFCVLTPEDSKLKTLDLKLIYDLDEIVLEISKYLSYKIYIGIDAPLIVPNETGNRAIEKNFNKDFSKYKISMLPVNRNLLTKYTKQIRGELLYEKLCDLGFQRDYKHKRVVFEVYPHATIAQCFNANKILPYKRKKGRDILFIKEQLSIYQKFLQSVSIPSSFLKIDLTLLKGKKLKGYEDMLDAFTSAYTLYHCKHYSHKLYKLQGVNTTPIH